MEHVCPQVLHQNGSRMLLNGKKLLLKNSCCILFGHGQLCNNNKHARVAKQTDKTGGLRQTRCIRATVFLVHKGISVHVTGETSPKMSRK